MDITAEPTNRISFASFKEKHPKDTANIGLPSTKLIQQFQDLL